VLAAVELDDYLFLQANQVDDVRPYGMLSAEPVPAKLTATKVLP